MAEKVGGIEYTIDADASGVKTAGQTVTASTNKMVDDFEKVDKQQEKSSEASKQATTVTIKETKAQVNAREVAARKIIRAQEKVAREIKELAAKNQRTAEKTASVIEKEAKEQSAAVKREARETARVAAAEAKRQSIIVQREARETARVAAAEAKRKANAVERALRQEATAQKQAADAAAKNVGQAGRRAGMAGVQIEQFVGSVQGGQDAMRAFSFQATDMGIVLGAPLIGAAIGLTTALVSALMPALFNSGKEVDALKEKLIELQETQLLTADQSAFLADQEKKSQKEKKKSIEKLEKEIKAKEKSIATDKASIDSAGKLLSLRKGQSVAEEKSQLNNSIKKTSEELLKLKATLSIANDEYANSSVKLKAYDLAAKGSNKRTGEQAESIQELTSALYEQNRITGKDERQLLQMTLSRAKATDAEKDAILSSYDLIKSKEAAIEATKKAAAGDAQLLTTMIAVHTGYKKQNAQLELNSKQLEEYNTRKRLGLGIDEQIPAAIQEEINKLEELRVKKSEMMEQDQTNKVIEQEFKSIQTEQGAQGDPLTALEDKLTAEREIIKAHTEILLQDEQLTQDQRNAIKKQGEDLTTSIQQQAADGRKKIEDVENRGRLNAVSQTFGAMSSLMNTESKKLFEVGKAAAIAGAIVDGYAAVSKTMASVPFPFNVPLAAAQAAASAVQVQGIAKQKIGGAQSMGATSSFSGGAAVTNTAPQSQGGTNVTVSGINPGDMFTGQQLMDTLRSVVGDGADVSFLGGG